jgi:hypothetical protein
MCAHEQHLIRKGELFVLFGKFSNKGELFVLLNRDQNFVLITSKKNTIYCIS